MGAGVPETWIGRHFGDLTSLWDPGDVWKPRHLRRVVSLKLVEMAGGGTWPQCAVILGIPWITAQRSLTVLKRSLLPGGLWPLLDTAVEIVAQELDAAAPHVDFAARRRTLSTWQIPVEDLAALTVGLLRLANAESSLTRATATALVWARVTQGDHLHSPSLEALREAQRSTKALVSAIGQLQTPSNRKGTRLRFLQRINDYADGLARALDEGRSRLKRQHPLASLTAEALAAT